MSYQIRFFEKNKADYSLDNITLTVTEGSDFASLALNRNNFSAWVTSGSTDASDCRFDIDWADYKTIDSIFLIKHNLKNYAVQYWDGASWQAFSPAIGPTTNTAETTFHEFTEVTTTKIRLTVYGTMTPDEDKYLYQFIATEAIGQLTGYPQIKAPTVSRNRQRSQMISGKYSIREQVGAFTVKLDQKLMRNTADVALIETLYRSNDGFLVWLCGGSESQFYTGAEGYRLEDIYLMKCSDEYQPELDGGYYWAGIKASIDLVEVID